VSKYIFSKYNYGRNLKLWWKNISFRWMGQEDAFKLSKSKLTYFI